MVAEALANVAAPRARDRVHAARRRPRRPPDGRGARQRHRRRRRRAPAAGWSASPTARRRSARAFALESPRGGGTAVRLEIPVDADGWRYSFADQIRYGDLDTNAHLNNVAVHQFFESARVAYMRGLFPEIDPMGRAGGFGMIFAETHVRFASPGFYEEDVRVDVRPEELRRSSVRDRVPDGVRGRRPARRRGLGHARRLRLRGRPRARRSRRRSPSVCAPRAPGSPFRHELRAVVRRAAARSPSSAVRREQLEAAADGLREATSDDPVEADPRRAQAAEEDARAAAARAAGDEAQGVPAPQPRAARRRPRRCRARATPTCWPRPSTISPSASPGSCRSALHDDPRAARRRAGLARRDRARRARRRRCARSRTHDWPLDELDARRPDGGAQAHLRARARRVRARRPRADARAPARVAQAREGPLVPAAAARGQLAGRA